MKKRFLALAAATLFLLPTGVAAGTEDYIVSFKDGINVTDAFERKYHLTQLTTEDHGIYTTDAVNAAKIEDHPAVEEVGETNIIRLSASPNDPYYLNGNQWNLSAINAPYGWTVNTGRKSRVVVIDTGFDFTHEDKGNILPGKDFINGGNVTKDGFTHGTNCAGVIAGAINNGKGIAGLTDQCEVIVINVFKADANNEATASDADVIAAIYSAVDDYQADVISMSFGGPTVDGRMGDAVKYAEEHNAILIAATGNSGHKGSPLEYPAAYDEVVGVANMNQASQIAARSTKNESVYISAPGTSIFTLANQDFTGQPYGAFHGTSLAAPHVAALAVLAKNIDPDITVEEFKYYLRTTGKDLETTGYDIKSGYGLIDFKAFLSTLAEDQTKTLAGSGTIADPYLIHNEDDLRLFCLTVSRGEKSAAAKLTADISVAPAFSGVTTLYSGTFNGSGHKISGLDESLFDTLDHNGGKVINLTVQGQIQNDIYGGIIATENNGVISNCHVEGSIESETAGGICGLNTGTVTGCSNRAAVKGMNAAGIAAVSHGGQVSQCYNHGEITSENGNAGGLCSFIQSGALLENSYNTGKITNTNTTGAVVNSANNATVRNCYYQKGSVDQGISNADICAKAADFMKTKGFVCMLNQGHSYFAADSENRNGGYPILGSSTLVTFFTDVDPSQWYGDAIYDLAAENILQGHGDHRFAPESTVTRAEFVTILANLSGVDLSAQSPKTPFTDVEENQWYAQAIHWAYEEELAFGRGEHHFGPGEEITRQEIAAFLTRYIREYGKTELPASQEMRFQDKTDVASWAKEDVAALTALGVISGFPDGTFRPNAYATRAEAAQMTRMTLQHL